MADEAILHIKVSGGSGTGVPAGGGPSGGGPIPAGRSGGGGGVGGGIAGQLGGLARGTMAGGAIFALASAANATARAVGDFALMLSSPSADPSQALTNMGGMVGKAGSGLTLAGAGSVGLGVATGNPLLVGVGVAISALGVFGGVVGEAAKSVGQLMQAIDGTVRRYAEYSPGLAMAQAQAEMTQIFGDIRRAQETTPALIQYIIARTELQQKYEDMKAKFMTQLTPVIIAGMEIAEKSLPLFQLMADGIEWLSRAISDEVGARIDAIREEMRRASTGQEQMKNLTEVILGQKEAPVFPFDMPPRPGPAF